MVAHDPGVLWALAAAELESSDAAVLKEHLADCPECREELDLIHASRLALRSASSAMPRVDWGQVDEALGAAVARKMLRPGWGGWFRPAWAAALALPVALAAIASLRSSPESEPVPAIAVFRAFDPARVSLVSGARVGSAGKERTLGTGESLANGDRLHTGRAGLALVELPDHSRVRLGASSELRLVRASPNEIALDLGRGRLAAKAHHAPGRPFVVDAGGLRVRVVGTAFTVSSTAAHVEVGVGEGTVLIEPELGQSMLLTAGKRVRFERAGWRMRQGALSAAQRSELAELGVELAQAEPAPPRRTAAAAELPAPIPAEPPAHPEAPAVLDEERAYEAAGQVVPPPEPGIQEPPGGAPISEAPLAGAAPASEPGELVDRPAVDSLPRDVEGLFLKRAEQALSTGRCERYQLGLSELLEGSESSLAREQARILRARCLRWGNRSLDADREYRLYLLEWPAGRWTNEARRATDPR